jgi:hypothetical protein
MGIYLNEAGARAKYIKMQNKKDKKLADEVKKTNNDKDFDEAYNKLKKFRAKNKKYTGQDVRDLAYYDGDNVLEPVRMIKGGKYDYDERTFSTAGKRRFNRDFSGPYKYRDYEFNKRPGDSEYNKTSIQSHMLMRKRNKQYGIKEACEYILSVLDEEYYYNEYED